MRIFGIIISYFLLCSLPSFALASSSYDWSQDLLAAFNATCVNSGQFTQEAGQQNLALQSILTNLRSDTSCSAISGALNSTLVSSSQIDALLTSKSARSQQLLIQGQIEQLIPAVLMEKDPTIQPLLATQLASLKIQLITLQSQTGVQHQLDVLTNAGTLKNFSSNLFSAMASGGMCLDPSLNKVNGLQIAAQSLAMSASFLNYPLGIGAFAIGSVLNDVFSYLLSEKYASSIRKLQNEQGGAAASCAMESLAGSYCTARDAKLILDAQDGSVDKSKLGLGIRLIDRDIVAFRDWIDRVRAGSKPKSSYDSKSKKDGLNFETSVYNDQYNLLGLVSEYRLKISKLQDASPLARTSLIRELIYRSTIAMADYTVAVLDLSAINSSSSGISQSSPFFLVFNYDALCGPAEFLTKGDLNPVKNPQGQCPVYQDSDIPDVDTVETRIQQVITTAISKIPSATVFRETDSLSVLAQAEQARGSNTTPKEFLQKCIGYTIYLQKTYGNVIPKQTQLDVLAVQDMCTRAVKELNEAATAVRAADRSPDEVLNNISAILIPVDGDSDRLEKALRLMVNWELFYLVRSGSFPAEFARIFRLSIQDAVSTLTRSGTINTFDATQDASNGQDSQTVNMQIISKRFGPAVQMWFKQIKSREDTLKSESASRRLAYACMQALGSPDESFIKDIESFCKGRSLTFTTRSKLDLAIKFDDVRSLAWRDRVCVLYDFKRKTQVLNLDKESDQMSNLNHWFNSVPVFNRPYTPRNG